MISEEKIQAARKAMRKGEPEGEIKEQLRREGYSDDDIRLVFTPHKYDMRSWYLSFAILVSLAGLIVLSRTRSLLILALGALLFYAYANEIKRVKRED